MGRKKTARYKKAIILMLSKITSVICKGMSDETSGAIRYYCSLTHKKLKCEQLKYPVTF